jgi:hypothetical protein
MTILIRLNNMGEITYNYITYDWFYLDMTSYLTVNKNTYVGSHL